MLFKVQLLIYTNSQNKTITAENEFSSLESLLFDVTHNGKCHIRSPPPMPPFSVNHQIDIP